MQDFEKLGVFYLGKAFDLGKKKRKDDFQERSLCRWVANPSPFPLPSRERVSIES